jgi:hypothetical protein
MRKKPLGLGSLGGVFFCNNAVGILICIDQI